ncbi:protein MLP2-like [Acanthopagrus latus]|uniref:protein MLP2-like n=1 Tax=Acanthopagrus latus TaxID=8177 RepID=UPI00187BEDD9|nr:protein MLP2-like [Acanthopagrus latus]
MDREERSEKRIRGGKEKKRSQQIQNTEVPQERHLGDMENNPVMDEFALLAIQRNMRHELRDHMVKLTKGRTEGRVNLEIKEDALTNILDQLRGKKTWSHEKELMEKQICALKKQFNTRTKTDTKDLKSQVQMLCKKLSLTLEDIDEKKSQLKLLQKALDDLPTMKTEEVIKYFESLQHRQAESVENIETKPVWVQLEKVKADNTVLQQKVCELDSEACRLKELRSQETQRFKSIIERLQLELYNKNPAEFEAHLNANQLEERLVNERIKVLELQDRLDKKKEAFQNLEKDAKRAIKATQTALKKAEDLLETGRLCWQQEKSSLLEEMERSRALHVAQLDEEKHKNDTLVATLKDLKQQLDSHRSEWREEKASLVQATEDRKKTVQDMQVVETMERSQASQQAQHEEQKEETRKLAAAMKKAEDLLETERFWWQVEKEVEISRALHMAQLEEKKHKNDILVALETERLCSGWMKTTLLEERRKQEEATALLVDQLDKLKHENDTLVAALRNAEQELKTSPIQASEEEEWGETESPTQALLGDLVSKKKKKKK